MKKFLAFLMAIVILTSAFSFIVQAVSPRNNHTIATATSFTISDTGLAEVYMRYDAYEDVMTEAASLVPISIDSGIVFP
jgi:hypothetical protein